MTEPCCVTLSLRCAASSGVKCSTVESTGICGCESERGGGREKEKMSFMTDVRKVSDPLS